MKTPLYIRFDTELKFNDSSCTKGIFAAMGEAKRKGSMNLAEHIWYINIASWFNRNLLNPSCFTEPICDSVKFRAQSWFKCRYSEYLEKSVSVVQLLRKHGVNVNVTLTATPGKIIYEDELQVVVIPNDQFIGTTSRELD